MKNCLKCNSDKIVPSAMVLDTGQYASGYMQIAVDEHHEALMFKQRMKSNVKVSV